MARARRKAADTATKTSPEKAREEAGAPRAPLEQNAEKKRKPRASQKGDRKRVRVSEGVYRDRYGLAATVKVNGIQRERRFPRETGMRTIQVWRTQTRASLQNLPKGAKHTLAHDAKRYLDEKKGQLASIRDRRRNLGTWFEKFGHIRTLTLEHHVNELNGQLRQWRKTLSGATCNHRRDALMNLVRVLYGDRAASGLSELKTFKKEPAKPRALNRAVIAQVLTHLEPDSMVRIRLELMHWTGMRPAQMGRLTRANFQLDAEVPNVIIGEAKAGNPASIPLGKEGMAAALKFISADAFGEWRTNGPNKALTKAAKAAGHERFTTYQIRHSFGMGLLESGTDVADIQDMYGHTNPRTTRIYAKASLEKKKKSIKNLQRADEIAAMKLASKERGSG